MRKHSKEYWQGMIDLTQGIIFFASYGIFIGYVVMKFLNT